MSRGNAIVRKLIGDLWRLALCRPETPGKISIEKALALVRVVIWAGIAWRTLPAAFDAGAEELLTAALDAWTLAGVALERGLAALGAWRARERQGAL